MKFTRIAGIELDCEHCARPQISRRFLITTDELGYPMILLECPKCHTKYEICFSSRRPRRRLQIQDLVEEEEVEK